MLLLTTSSDLVKVNTSAATDIEVHASWADNVSGTITPGRTNTASIVGTGDTTIVAGPSSGQRNVHHLNIRNNHAATSCIVIVSHSDGTNVESLAQATLLAGEWLTFDQTGRWIHFGVTGGPYPKSSANVATQAEMETGTSTARNVAPGRQHFHPGHPKCWVRIPPDLNYSGYNITSVTLAAGLATITIGTDFSSADWVCQAHCKRSATSLTVTNLKYAAVRSATQAAGSVVVEVWDGTATTAVQEHPETYYMSGFGDQ
jgi:hypothetical protein